MAGLALTTTTDIIPAPRDVVKIRVPVGESLVVGEIDAVKYPTVIQPPAPDVPKVKAKKPARRISPPRRMKAPARVYVRPENPDDSDEDEDEDEDVPELAEDDEIAPAQATIADIRAHLGIVDADAGGVSLAKIRRSFATMSEQMKNLYNNTVVPAVRLLLLNPGMECIPETDRKDVALYSVLTGWTTAIDECPEMLSTVHELAPKGVAETIGL